MVTDFKKKALEGGFFFVFLYSAEGIHVGCVEVSVSIRYERSQACLQIIYEIFFVSQQLQIWPYTNI
jgi:hypothetical protein